MTNHTDEIDATKPCRPYRVYARGEAWVQCDCGEAVTCGEGREFVGGDPDHRHDDDCLPLVCPGTVRVLRHLGLCEPCRAYALSTGPAEPESDFAATIGCGCECHRPGFGAGMSHVAPCCYLVYPPE